MLPADRLAALVDVLRGSARVRRVGFAPTRRHAVVVAACLAAVPLVYWGLRTGPFFDVRAIEVEGAPPALTREVKAALAPIAGESLLAVDGEDVIARVEALPQVAEASYDRAFPQTLVVRVQREVGRAVLRQGRQSWLVSTRGRVIRPVPRRSHAGLPRVWLPPGTTTRVGDVISDPPVRGAVRALAALRAEPLPVVVHSVDARGPLSFKLARGIELRLGDSVDLHLKLAVAARVLEVMDPPDPSQRLFLDVTVPERPIVGSSIKSQVEVES